MESADGSSHVVITRNSVVGQNLPDVCPDDDDGYYYDDDPGYDDDPANPDCEFDRDKYDTPENCEDDLDSTDRFGDTCAFYRCNQWACDVFNADGTGAFDDDDFTAKDQCCACGGGTGNVPENAKAKFQNGDDLKRAVRKWVKNDGERENLKETYGEIGDWDTSSVRDMSFLFCVTPKDGDPHFNELKRAKCPEEAFGEPDEIISNWDTSAVTDMRYMFAYNDKFDHDINKWTVSKVEDMSHMFYNASAFTHSIRDWDVRKVKTADKMFHGKTYDQALGWCVNQLRGQEIRDATDGSRCDDMVSIGCGIVWSQATCPSSEPQKYCQLNSTAGCWGNYHSFVETSKKLTKDEDPGDAPGFNKQIVYVSPAFASLSLDGDDRIDVVQGEKDGSLAFYNNTGSNFDFQRVVGEENPFEGLELGTDGGDKMDGGYSSPTFVDLNGDGKLDLVVGGGDRQTLAYFINEGSSSKPMFEMFKKIPEDGTFGGQHEASMCSKVDKKLAFYRIVEPDECPDGLSPEFPNCAEVACGKLCEGDSECGTDPNLDNCPGAYDVYQRVCELNNPFTTVKPQRHAAPAFADVNGDGAMDLLVGHESGGVTYYRNVGTEEKPMFSRQIGTKDPFKDVQVKKFSKPVFWDVDRDGDQDLLVGNELGGVVYYRNSGSASVPKYETVADADNPLAAVVGPTYAAPAIATFDGKTTLAVGSVTGILKVYHDAPSVAYKKAPEDENLGTNFFNEINKGIQDGYTQSDAKSKFVGPLDGGRPTFVDLDGDGRMDLAVVAQEKIRFYSNTGDKFVEETTANPFGIVNGKKPRQAQFMPGRSKGVQDLVILDADAEGTLYVYENEGKPSELPVFEKSKRLKMVVDDDIEEFDVDGGIEEFLLADIDDDGVSELVIVSDDKQITLYINTADASSEPTFEKAPIAADARTEAEELEKEGELRKQLGAEAEGRADEELVDLWVQRWRNHFEGIELSEKTRSFSLVDIDEDGDLDLVALDVSSLDGNKFGFTTFCNEGTPSKPRFSKKEGPCKGGFVLGSLDDELSDRDPASFVAFGDVDADDDLDLVILQEVKTIDEDQGGSDEGSDRRRLNKKDKVTQITLFENGHCVMRDSDDPCSGNARCNTGLGYKKDKCECPFNFDGVQCEACKTGHSGEQCRPCPQNQKSKGPPGGFPVWDIVCEPCDAGKHSETGQEQCDNCTRGMYSPGEGESCKPCDAGKFANDVGMASCEDCGPGKSSNEGATECADCAPGRFSTGGSKDCNRCPEGKFSGAGKDKCQPCEPGKFNKDKEKSECTLADSGYFVKKKGAKSQERCPKGKFSSGSKNEECTKCDAGKFAENKGMGECELAHRGYFVSKSGAEEQEKCKAGTYSSGEGATNCTEANSGFFVEKEGATKPEKCPEGKFSSGSGATECEACHKGEFTNKEGQASCTPAEPGHFVEEATKQDECQPGEHASGSGNEKCEDCEPGKYAASTKTDTCTPASKGHYVSKPGAEEQEKCKAGTYSSGKGATNCTEANSGSFVKGEGAEDQVPCPAGRFSSKPGATECEDCPKGEFTKQPTAPPGTRAVNCRADEVYGELRTKAARDQPRDRSRSGPPGSAHRREIGAALPARTLLLLRRRR